MASTHNANTALARNETATEWASECLARDAPKMLTSTPSPSVPPSCCITCNMPEAAPTSPGSTPPKMVAVRGINDKPTPVPSNRNGPSSAGK